MSAVEMITQIGFPIVAAIGVAGYIVKLNNDHREDVRELTRENNEKIDKLSKVVNNNTLAMTKIYERLGALLHDEKE